ncbi:NUDIX domain-containing protein [Streptomyces sp. NPDC098781]|uniref:NUDIX domain-containing protein n=1 Tax=Streptomyces sp. NPDC098781 TaxID=3366097 RepID=UPI00382575D1
MIGAMGENPRKGHSHTWDDVESEVCDVITTGMVALMRMNTDAQALFERHMERIASRDLPKAEPAPEASSTAPSGTAALLVNGKGQYLLHLRDANKPINHAGMWCFLGGHTEPGETEDEGITRVLQEETGLLIPDLTPFATVETVVQDGTIQGSVKVYLGRWDGLAHEIELREGIALRWTDADELQWMTVDAGTTAVINAHRTQVVASRNATTPLVLRVPQARASR